ncbi:MAG: type II toxin-antitoxin system RelE/ParE family toxin [Deltaproteobacteria bacterium]|nr:type II toxin-antitoxin system RelE/ParE family toxin [Deltaproteobacteria bacterium]
MASYSVALTRTAEKQLRRVAKAKRAGLVDAIQSLADVPRPRGARKLEGYVSIYRVRVGQYRIVYEVIDERVVVIVLKLGHRKDIYR